MKRFFLFLVVFFAVVAAQAEVVTTGIVRGLQPKAGTLTLQSDQNQKLITLYGVANAKVETTNGMKATLADVQLGTRVTVNYATQDKRWLVQKILLPPPQPLPQGMSVNAEPSTSRAGQLSRDNDITTHGDQKKPKVMPVRRAN